MGRIMRVSTPVDVTVVAGNTIIAVECTTGTTTLGIRRWGLYFRGTSATASPISVEICRCSALGAGTNIPFGSAASARFVSVDGQLAATPASLARYNSLGGDTITEILNNICIHPQGGYESVENPPIPIGAAGGSEFFAIRIQNAGTDPLARAWIEFEE